MNDAAITTEPVSKALVPPPTAPEKRLTGPQWGMITFLVSEVAFFSTLIVAYLAYMGKDTTGPKPKDVLKLPLVIGTTFCLLASSCTIHVADGAIRAGRESSFRGWWTATIALGVAFLAGTGYEWYELIAHHHLTISTNLFGTTFYTLVGFHGAHVTVGVILMTILLGLASRGAVTAKRHGGVELVSWYWHFVDVVWVVVFTVVYVVGR